MRGSLLFCCTVLVSVSLIQGDPIRSSRHGAACPGGRRPTLCYANPCDLELGTCNSDPTLECRANYCLGCEVVDFYDVTGVKVTCRDNIDGIHKKKLD
ncbi:hypothetical protein KP79_PYT21850 [Mizuhopecten yessoensis]|uniref:Uncharacterized protein n=1 Tax=Mizuhopecten yessoensis TaxID=6573 RepID=A0A210QS20_MIZYE|nr:hypothetical protein KP79_PYT21850 [Mizuhopecten yessoensis]